MVLLRLIRRFSPFVKQKPTELGRWSLLNSSNALQKRIDMANIDHCGPCGFEQISDEKNKKFYISTGHSDNNKDSK